MVVRGQHEQAADDDGQQDKGRAPGGQRRSQWLADDRTDEAGRIAQHMVRRIEARRVSGQMQQPEPAEHDEGTADRDVGDRMVLIGAVASSPQDQDSGRDEQGRRQDPGGSDQDADPIGDARSDRPCGVEVDAQRGDQTEGDGQQPGEIGAVAPAGRAERVQDPDGRRWTC